MPVKLVKETKWFPVFKSGRHTSAQGVTREWTEADVDRIVEMNKGREDRIPAVLGHPATDDPAFGWGAGIKKVVRDGAAYVYAKLRDVYEPVAEMVNAGLYKHVSIKVQPDGRLRHIGFLGAVQPAVEGMEPARFEGPDAGDLVDLEFSTEETTHLQQSILRRVSNMIGRVRDFLVETQGVEKAEAILSADMMNWLRDDIESIDKQTSTPTFSNEGGTMPTPNLEDLQTQISTLQGQVQQFSSENATLKAANTELVSGNAALLDRITKIERDRRRDGYEQFCAGLIAEGKMFPAEREGHVLTMMSLENAQEMEFSSGEKKPAVVAYQDNLKARPKVLEFSHVATGGRAPEGGAGSAAQKLETKVQEIMTRDKCAYAQAFSTAQSEHPDLAQEYATDVRG